MADKVADTIGSWPFIITQTLILITWITLNVTLKLSERWDIYPFILLNLALSFQAAYSGPVIMMSQNRQSAKDRLAAEIDHDVNTKAELEVSNLMRHIEELSLRIEENHAEAKRLMGMRQKRKKRTGTKVQKTQRKTSK